MGVKGISRTGGIESLQVILTSLAFSFPPSIPTKRGTDSVIPVISNPNRPPTFLHPFFVGNAGEAATEEEDKVIPIRQREKRRSFLLVCRHFLGMKQF